MTRTKARFTVGAVRYPALFKQPQSGFIRSGYLHHVFGLGKLYDQG